MIADWPDTLPCRFTATSQQEESADNLLRSQTSIGPAKTRRRSTAGVSTLSGELVMTGAQRETFADFIRNTIADGALPFTFKNPYGADDIIVRYVPPYSVKRLGAGKWTVTLHLEVLP